ncbi:MAG: hypothetical protein L6Q76_06655 [Polyangiaceae bacterium]|nr:hypothetical protein [Polyangiaceae bacterium]
MSSSAARRIAGKDFSEEMQAILADQAEAADDDEPLEPELLAALAESDAQIARGEIVPWEVVREEMRRTHRSG